MGPFSPEAPLTRPTQVFCFRQTALSYPKDRQRGKKMEREKDSKENKNKEKDESF